MSSGAVSARDVDAEHMDRALELARQGRGRVSPNPMVGAVVVRDGAIVGEGFHAIFGGDHAEVVALRAAGDRARGADVYVNLEPCAHRGQTPPCTEALLAAGVRRVVIGCRDPHPPAAGGAGVLENAGIDVVTGIRAEEAARLNAGFLWHNHGMGPWVSLKLAVSRDLKIAARPGERTLITGAEADRWVHRLRAGYDAIMVGGRTAVIDDPLLTVRGTEVRRAPQRVVVDPNLELPADSQLVDTAGEAPVVVLCGCEAPSKRREVLESRGVRVEDVGTRPDGELSLREVVATLDRLDIASVLVEGGGRLATALLREDLVQRQYLLLAPISLGPEGVRAYDDQLAPSFGDWRVERRTVLGDDVLIELDNVAALRALGKAA